MEMTSKREEERNEKIIRGLMKLPPNRRCINCNSLGPQYVCTDFWTFVCTTCSGIHREFTHRVKSVSMAKFTSQEVDALQKGGNQRARELFLRGWDMQRSRLPDNSNVDKVRQFIKNVYVDKIYAIEKTHDRPPRDLQTIRSPEDQTRRASSYHSYSQSPPYDFQYEERQYGKRASGLTRKPGSDRGHYGGNLASFLSPRNSSDGSFNRVSVGSPFIETSRDISSDGLQPSTGGVQHLDGASGNKSERTFHPQRASSFDGSSMPFKSVNSPGLVESGFIREQSAVSSLNRSSSSSLPHSSIPRTFNSSEPCSTTFVRQNFSPASLSHAAVEIEPSPLAGTVDISQPYPLTDLTGFESKNPSKGLETSSLSLFPVEQQQQLLASDVVGPTTGGWATFDMPQNVVAVNKENIAITDVPSSAGGGMMGNFNPFSVINESSINGDSTELKPSVSVNAFGLEAGGDAVSNDSQLWNAFDYSPIENLMKSSGLDSGFKIDSQSSPGDEAVPPSSGLSPNFAMELNLPTVSSLAGVDSLSNNPKSMNPFDLPDDSEVDPNSMFWDISSLQAALPNPQAPSSFISRVDHSWFPESFAASYAPIGVSFDPAAGSLGFVPGASPSTQIQNIHAQGPVASSIGGNPFA